MQLKGPEWYKLEENKFLDEACVAMAVFSPTQGFKGKTFHNSGFSSEETLISAFAVPLCRGRGGGERECEEREGIHR